MNGYTWLRLYHGTFNDPKWPLVARLSKQTVGVVVSIWTPLLEYASMNEDRGSVDKFCPEEIDVLYGYADGTTASVFQVMKERGIITPDNRIAAWDDRQPMETDNNSRRARTSTERVRKYRERKTAKSANETDETHETLHVTPETFHETDETHETPIREDNIRLENINTPPISPQGETPVCVSALPSSSLEAETPEQATASETVTEPGIAESVPVSGNSSSETQQETLHVTQQETHAETEMKRETVSPETDSETSNTVTAPQVDTSHGNPAWKEFNYLYSLWPNQQGKEKAWREYAYLRARHLVPESYVLAEVIARFKAEDRKWKRGYVPMMNNWLHDRRWDDVPDKAPAPSYAPDENGRTRYVVESEQDYSEPSKFCGLTELI